MVFLAGRRVLLPARIHPGKTQCMERVNYEVNTEGIQQIVYDDFHKRKLNESTVYLHDHHHLLLQDKLNKRLNFLTIIQSIFVLLALMACVYGMSFAFMPELELRYGYFIVLGIMVLIVSGFIRYFFKRGWFD